MCLFVDVAAFICTVNVGIRHCIGFCLIIGEYLHHHQLCTVKIRIWLDFVWWIWQIKEIRQLATFVLFVISCSVNLPNFLPPPCFKRHICQSKVPLNFHLLQYTKHYCPEIANRCISIALIMVLPKLTFVLLCAPFLSPLPRKWRLAIHMLWLRCETYASAVQAGVVLTFFVWNVNTGGILVILFHCNFKCYIHQFPSISM